MAKKRSLMSEMAEANRQHEEARKHGAPLHPWQDDGEQDDGGGGSVDIDNMTVKEAREWQEGVSKQLLGRLNKAFDYQADERTLQAIAIDLVNNGGYTANDFTTEAGQERFVGTMAGRLGAKRKPAPVDPESDDDEEPADVFSGMPSRGGSRREKVPDMATANAEWIKELGAERAKYGLR